MLGKHGEPDDEAIAHRLASDEAEVLRGLTLTPVQQLLHIPPAIVYLANIAMNGGLVISRDAANRFARLQLHYLSACQRLRPDQATAQLLRLSPSMLTPPPELVAALDAADDDACRRAAAAEAARATRIAAAEESARALVAEDEMERRRAATRVKARRKKQLDAPGTRSADAVGERPRGSGSANMDANGDGASADKRAPSTAAGPTLDELRAAPSNRLEVFDPTEWTEVGGKATVGGKVAEDSSLARASKRATPTQPRAASNGFDRTKTADDSEDRAHGARTVPDAVVSAVLPPSEPAQPQQQLRPPQQPQPPQPALQQQPQPQLVTGSPLLQGLSRSPARAKPQQQSLSPQRRPRAPLQPAAPPPSEPPPTPTYASAAANPSAATNPTYNSGGDRPQSEAAQLEAACAAQLSAPGGTECARTIAAAVQRYVHETLASERAAHEAALCKALKDAHERSDARAQSLRLRLYISETKCQELEAAVRELQLGALTPAELQSGNVPCP